MSNESQADAAPAPSSFDWTLVLCRSFAWGTIAVLFAYLLNNYLSYWRGWPGPSSFFEAVATTYAFFQVALYIVAAAAAIAYGLATRQQPLRPDSEAIYAITAFIVRA
jgi:hypothetical protein